MDYGYYNMDCMEGMKQFPDKYFDIAITDPPYFSGPERRGYYGRKVSPIGVQRHYEPQKTGKYQEKITSVNWNVFPNIRSYGAVIILTGIFQREGSYGTSAMAPTVSRIVR